MRYIILTVAIISMTAATGCFEVELEIPVATEVAIIQGNELLHKANATLHGEILRPARVNKNFGIADQGLSSVRLSDFRIQVTDDAVAGENDVDDLKIVISMVIYVRSLDEESELQDIAIAWYYADEADGLDAGLIQFELDEETELMPYLEEGFELYSKGVSGVPMDDVSVEGIAVFAAM